MNVIEFVLGFILGFSIGAIFAMLMYAIFGLK